MCFRKGDKVVCQAQRSDWEQPKPRTWRWLLWKTGVMKLGPDLGEIVTVRRNIPAMGLNVMITADGLEVNMDPSCWLELEEYPKGPHILLTWMKEKKTIFPSNVFSIASELDQQLMNLERSHEPSQA